MSIKNLADNHQWNSVDSEAIVPNSSFQQLTVTSNPSLPSNFFVLARNFKIGSVKFLFFDFVAVVTTGVLQSFITSAISDEYRPSSNKSLCGFFNVASVVYPVDIVFNSLGQLIVSLPNPVPSGSSLNMAFGSLVYD